MREAMKQVFAGMVACLLVVAVFSSAARAQDAPMWAAGKKLSAGSTATTSTLHLTSGQEERTYAIDGMDATIRVRFLRLSGEREVKLAFERDDANKQVFTAPQGRLAIVADASAGMLVADFKTSQKGTGLALIDIQISDSMSSATLAIDSSTINFESDQGNLYIRAFGGQAFREKLEKGYRLVVPMDSNAEVRIAVSMEPLDEEKVKEVDVSAANQTGKVEDLAVAPAQDLPHRS